MKKFLVPVTQIFIMVCVIVYVLGIVVLMAGVFEAFPNWVHQLLSLF